MEIPKYSLAKLKSYKRTSKLVALFLVCLFTLASLHFPLFTQKAQASGNDITVRVRIETPEKTIFNDEVVIEDCTVVDTAGGTHTFASPKAVCALAAAAKKGGFIYKMENLSFGLYLTEIDGVTADSSNYWLYRVNFISPWVGLTDYDLSNGDELLLSYGPSPDKPLNVSVSKTSVTPGEEFTITSRYYDDNSSDFQPADDATVYLGNTTLATDQNGTLTTNLSQPGTYTLYAEKEDYVRSNRLQIEVNEPSPAVQVSINVDYLGQTIWKGTVSVDKTDFVDSNGNAHSIDHPTALGALVEASKSGGFPVKIVSSTYGFYVESIKGFSAQGWDGWNYMVNGNAPPVGLGSYQISTGDNLAIYYSPWPWRLKANRTEIVVSEEIILTAEKYDSSTQKWEPAPGTTVKIDDQELETDQNSQVRKTFSQAGNYQAYIISGVWPNSPTLTITVSEKPSSVPPISQDKLQSSAYKALAYLRNQQSFDGSIENAGVSAWAAMAFASAGVYPQTVKKDFSLIDFLKTYAPASGNSATDFARQILAVVASGENPRDFGTDLIGGLKNFYQDNQIGNKNYINDDIFGVLALLAAGENPNQNIIQDSLSYILSHQNQDGGFGYSCGGPSDVDTTSAAIQALVLAKNKGASVPPNLDVVLSKAKDFLKASQNSDGGFPYSPGGTFGQSNSASTSWVIQALAALGEDACDWQTKEGLTPYHFLLSLQKSDGSFSWMKGESSQNLMTAYAVPALMGKSWPITLKQKEGSGEEKKDDGLLPYLPYTGLKLLSFLLIVLALLAVGIGSTVISVRMEE